MIATEKILHGVSVACVTPMTDDGAAVDYDAIAPYVDFLCDRGVDGLFVVGTTGEGCLLSLDERRRAITEFVHAARGRLVVVPQCGSLVAEETRELIHQSSAVGADGAAVVTPFYFSYTQTALYDYYAGVLEMAHGFPIYAYNIPQLTNNAVDVRTMARLAAAYPNFCGVKDSSGNASGILEYVRALPPRIAVIVGSDSLFLSLLFSGIHGCVSGPGSVIPEPFVKVYAEFRNGALDDARASQKVLTGLSEAVGGGGDLDLLKKVLAWRGLKAGSVRAPLPRVSPERERTTKTQFQKLWEAAGFTL